MVFCKKRLLSLKNLSDNSSLIVPSVRKLLVQPFVKKLLSLESLSNNFLLFVPSIRRLSVCPFEKIIFYSFFNLEYISLKNIIIIFLCVLNISDM